MKKIVPKKELSEVADSPKGLFVFKTDVKNQFHPFELLDHDKNPTLIVPLRRTSRVTERLLDQHGFHIRDAHYIDILSKHIDSSLTHDRTTYLHKTSLKEIHAAIEAKIKDFGPGPKTLIIEDLHSLSPHHGSLNTKRFIDHLSKTMDENMTKTVVLTNHAKTPIDVSKFLLGNSEKIIEKPN